MDETDFRLIKISSFSQPIMEELIFEFISSSHKNN